MLVIYTGNGEGKTAAALGHALRKIGHGKKAIIIQLMKGRKDIGEYKIQYKLPALKVEQFGRKQFVNLKNPSKKDRELALNGFTHFKKELKNNWGLIVFDEACLAASAGLIDTEELIKVIATAPKNVDVILTGRKAPKKLLSIADQVTLMKLIKHPYKKGVKARKGYEY